MNKSIKILSLVLLVSGSFVMAEEAAEVSKAIVEAVESADASAKKTFKSAAQEHAKSVELDAEITDADVDAFFESNEDSTSKDAIERFIAKLAVTAKLSETTKEVKAESVDTDK